MSVCGIFYVTMGIAIVTILLTLHLLIYFVIKLKVNQISKETIALKRFGRPRHPCLMFQRKGLEFVFKGQHLQII